MSHRIKRISAPLPPSTSPQEHGAVCQTWCRLGSDWLALPFDLARAQYAQSVRAGLLERSLLASARFERGVAALERLALGAMARGYY